MEIQKNIEHLNNKRHSLAHLLAAAVLELYPTSIPTIGPFTDTGFYYDFDFTESIREEDLDKIENKMKELLVTWHSFERSVVNYEEAKKYFINNSYKLALIEDINNKGEEITFYKSGNFTDLCRGGHVSDMAEEVLPDSFKLEKLAGAYWRGDATNKQLTRIYGLAFDTKEDLDKYIWQQEEAKKRDHRDIGERMDLFTFDESIGKGLPIWLPRGNIIKEEIEKWAKETEDKWGYSRVTTPIITKEKLFFTSGHLPLYKDSMYAPLQIEGENYYIKPMNCPFHHKAFAARPKTYRDLPVRLCEYGWCHRYEDSGSLFGLMRVRGMQMNDAHIYIQKEKAVDEFVEVIKMHEYYYKILGIKDYQMELALRDPSKMDKYHGDEQDWKDAEDMTKEAMEKSGVRYVVVNEGAAFYGPKMDFQIYSSIGRAFTASTNQLDLYMGKAFDLQYVDKDGQKKTPAIIHRAPLGTHERFIGFLIEHFAGVFPVWLSPVQVSIVAVKQELHSEYAESVYKKLKDVGVRVEIDDRNESLGKRIRAAKDMKVPYIIVIGDKEKEANILTIETRGEKIEGIGAEDFINKIKIEISERILN